MAWAYLIAAGVFEAVWALALKQSDGFSKPLPSIVFLVFLVASMILLAVALRSLPIGTGYAVWVGIGAVGAAVGGLIFLGEETSWQRLVPIGLIAAGVVWLALGES